MLNFLKSVKKKIIVWFHPFNQRCGPLLGSNLAGFIFEQEYQRKEDWMPVNEMAQSLDKFFQLIPKDNRYHLELRTDLYVQP